MSNDILKARGQHYVPCMLQSAFAKAGRGKNPQVHVFDKQTDRTFCTAPGNILQERDFNRYDDGKYIVCMEGGAGKIESQAAPVLKRILSDRSLAGLTLEDRVKVAAFVALQQVRGPSTRINMIDVAEKMRERFRAMGDDPEKIPQLRGGDDPEQIKLAAINLASENLPKFTESIAVKVMLLIEAAPSTTFLLGDHPVVKANQNDLGGIRGNLGLKSVGIEIYLPIAPDLVVAFWCPTLIELIEGALRHSEKMDGNISPIALLGFGPEADNIRSMRARLKDHINNLRDDLCAVRNGLPIRSRLENMDYYNSLQVIYSERRLISSDGNFALVRSMIAGDESLRTGPRMQVV